MLRRLVIAAVLAAASLGAAAPAAQAEFFIAYGTGLTNCSVTMKYEYVLLAPWWRAKASVDCDKPVEMTAHAYGNEYFSFEPCSGFRDRCASSEPPEGEAGWSEGPGLNGLVYDVTLRAPVGQGWLGAPDYCTGIGTDNLRCRFEETGRPAATF